MEQLGPSPARDKMQKVESEIIKQYRDDAKRRARKIANLNYEKNFSDWDNWESYESDQPAQDTPLVSAEKSPKPAEPTEPANSLGFFFDQDELLDGPDEIIQGDETVNAQLESSRAETAMRELIERNFISAGRAYTHAERDQLASGLLLAEAKKLGRSAISSRNSITDSLRQEIADAKERQDAIKDISPEGHTAYYGFRLRDYVHSVASGQLVETPYVKEHLDHTKSNMASGQPTFLHGHLGSGKTELALTAAKQFSIEQAALESAVDYCKSHPSSTKAKRREDLVHAYRRYKSRFTKALQDGDSSAIDQFAPLVISGSKDLTSQDLYADKTLKLTRFNGKTLLEHMKDIDVEFEKWRFDHLSELENLSPADRDTKEKEAADKILELYKLKNQAFGTEVETVKQALYRGVEEGRPVIIDEINAIPATVLISLNDILQRRPGQTCYIPGVGQTKIKEGFSITMTGNLDTPTITYGGTNDLNPAFLSRLDIIEHDYLPMSATDRSYDVQADPSKNELFQAITAYLVDRQGNLQLPEAEKSLRKLFALCQLAHESQLVFEGKWRESSTRLHSDSGDEIEPRLEKSVLSIRNILNVLREWDRGSEKDLDKALWDGFIAGITNPDDQNFMLALSAQHGFFQPSNGYQVAIKEHGASFTSFSEIHPSKYTYRPQPIETLSAMDAIDAIFGPRPEREVYPELSLDDFDSFDSDLTVEEYDKIAEQITYIKNAIGALEVLSSQCGCSVMPEATP